MNVRGRLLAIAGTLNAEARRSRIKGARATDPGLLESLAAELEHAAEELAGLSLIASDGPEPTPEEMEDLLDTQPIYPLPPRARPKA